MTEHTTSDSSTTTGVSTDDHDGDDEIDREDPLSAGWRTVYKAMGVDTGADGR